MFDLEYLGAQEESFKDTDITKVIGKQTLAAVSISLNLMTQSIFLCNCDPQHLVASVKATLKNWASQSKAKKLFLTLKQITKFIRVESWKSSTSAIIVVDKSLK